MRMMSDLRYYKLDSDVKKPVRATSGSACFDIYSFFKKTDKITVFRSDGYEKVEKVIRSPNGDNLIPINPYERVMVPTGLIFDIPNGYSVRLYSRSSMALKEGLMLANNVRIIDSDYVDPVFVILVNISGYIKYIESDNRICQAELYKNQPHILQETFKKPEIKTERDGGFGSTGKE